MSFVPAMTLREMRASWKRLLFFFICLSIGVGAIVAIRSVIQNVRGVFAGEARALISGDLVISSNQALDPKLTALIDERLRAANAISHASVEVATMVRSADPSRTATRMVELRAVESAFPLYGELKLANGKRFEYSLLQNFGVLVRPELLAQLGLLVGDRLLIGTQPFTIRGVIEGEPGRRLGAFSLGPRVFVSVRGSRQDRSSHLRQPRLSPASGEGLRFGDRPAGQPPARRLCQQLCPRPLVQGD